MSATSEDHFPLTDTDVDALVCGNFSTRTTALTTTRTGRSIGASTRSFAIAGSIVSPTTATCAAFW